MIWATISVMRVTVRAGSKVASSAGNDPPNGRAIEPAESTCDGAPGEALLVILDIFVLLSGCRPIGGGIIRRGRNFRRSRRGDRASDQEP